MRTNYMFRPFLVRPSSSWNTKNCQRNYITPCISTSHCLQLPQWNNLVSIPLWRYQMRTRFMLRGQKQASNVASFRRMAEHVMHEMSTQCGNKHVIHELSPHCGNNKRRNVGKLNFFIKFRKKSLLTVNSKNKTTETRYGHVALGETNTLWNVCTFSICCKWSINMDQADASTIIIVLDEYTSTLNCSFLPFQKFNFVSPRLMYCPLHTDTIFNIFYLPSSVKASIWFRNLVENRTKKNSDRTFV
jgi:ribosomal protein L32